MLDSSEDVLSRQRLEVLAGMVMAEPIQKAAAAQKNAFAGLRLQAPHPAQIVRKGSQKRSIRVSIYTGNGSNESLRSHSQCVSQRRHCSNAWRVRRKRAQIAIDDILMDLHRTTARRGKLAKARNPAQVNLGGRSLITKREKMLREAIHLATECAAAQALEHPTIRKIELEHSAPPALWRRGIPRPMREA
ncbi:hypothetical protein MEA186_02739 [Mesorhizobium amorphae CCNWGS0123]|uniref:Uncharacterized protein n=1 Tax=Mesorhizobium amorphae CCNWGS0123 TaxID=1082933 RepID=G6Y3Q1_9HYPH|nr:hypothetical protein A6B35_33310 [Mesorhizobium amorphae CCNWGS0123]EHH13626.1 hypothetical protein MEA186_02739 [Mesorhizobium amorphae CCNWGS0123]